MIEPRSIRGFFVSGIFILVIMNKPVPRILLYTLCLYNIYLYLPDALDIFKIDFYPPDPDVLTYFDAVFFLFGDAILG